MTEEQIRISKRNKAKADMFFCRQKGIPVTGAKEEVAEDFIDDWNELFSDALTNYIRR